MKLGKFGEICYEFFFLFVIFALLSEIFHGKPELASNLCWAVGFTIFNVIRGELKPATRRIVNLMMFGVAVVLVPILFFYSPNSTGDYVALALVLIYSAYRFCAEYEIKP
jgi:prolipoprotein diacylglyceryltransferase